MLIQNLIVFITENWEQIEIKSESKSNSEPEPFKPKYEFPTFEEWQISVEESYHKLHKTVDDNLKGAWPTFEFVLSILAILKIEEITLPFIGIILGPPSGIKTLILELLRKDSKGKKRRNTFFTHNFNAHSIISHSIISHASALPSGKREGSQHMLLKMKNNIVLAPELAPIFTKKEEELREILGIITAVADGSGYESDTGFGHAGFAGQYFFVMAGAAVEIPWYAYKVLGQLGPKLFFFRLSEVKDTVEDYLDILEGNTFAARKHVILLALDEYIDIFESCPEMKSQVDKEAEIDGVRNDLRRVDISRYRKSNDREALEIIIKLGELLRHLRAQTMTYKTSGEGGRDDFVYQLPIIERGQRAIRQLANIALGHAFSSGKSFINMEDIPLVTKIVLSTAPVERCRLFDQLLNHTNARLTTKEFAELRGVHPDTARRTMTELKIVGLVNIYKNDTHEKDTWEIQLKDEFDWFLTDDFRIVKMDYDTASYKKYLEKIEASAKPTTDGTLP